MSKFQLTPLQKKVLLFFGKNKFGHNFYWTGGTRLAYFWKHRQSFDLDFFSDNVFFDDEYLIFIRELKEQLKIRKVSFKLDKNRRFYLLDHPQENIKLELVFFPFPAIQKRKKLVDFSLSIDSLSDVMTNKILSIYQRNEPKDLFDLYYYLIHKPDFNFIQLVQAVNKKFGVVIEPILLIAKIEKLTDQLGILNPILPIAQPRLSEKVRDFFREIFNDLVKEKIK